MVPFRGIAVAHGSAATEASAGTQAVYQGVYVTGAQPLWLLAHRDRYIVHEADTREGAAAVPVAAMCAWHRKSGGGGGMGFVVVTGEQERCELRFCRMPRNVRPLLSQTSANG